MVPCAVVLLSGGGVQRGLVFAHAPQKHIGTERSGAAEMQRKCCGWRCCRTANVFVVMRAIIVVNFSSPGWGYGLAIWNFDTI